MRQDYEPSLYIHRNFSGHPAASIPDRYLLARLQRWLTRGSRAV
jgi:hypothetical protein